MKFEEIIIKNFRNFKNNKINLNNKNIIFGLNNVGKSNFIFALRLLFDWNLRTYEIMETDFYNSDTSEKIEIICTLIIDDLNNLNDNDEKLLSKLKDAIEGDSNIIFVKTTFDFNRDQEKKELFWGSSINNLQIVGGTINSNDLYRVFEVIYISATSNIDEVFKYEKKNYFRLYEEEKTDDDKIIENRITEKIQEINTDITSLSRINKMQLELNDKLKIFDNSNYEVLITSDFAIKGYEKGLSIFMKDKNSDKPYPVAGDGVKKKTSYALIDLIKQKQHQERKIILYMIEEPENHLFYSSHYELSDKILKNDLIFYLFLVTHSPLYINYSKEKSLLNLIKFSKDNDNSLLAPASIFEMPKNFPNWQKIFVNDFARALFYDRVILVEGYSEEVLFSKIINDSSIYIIKVIPSTFLSYYKILFNLKIRVFLKTDNDISRRDEIINFTGLQRLKSIYNVFEDFNEKLKNEEFKLDLNELEKLNLNDDNSIKKYGYDKKYLSLIKEFENKNLYISHIDLENDLEEALSLDEYDENYLKQSLNLNEKTSLTNYLTRAKLKNMVDFCSILNNECIEKIKNHKNFLIIKDVLNLLEEKNDAN